jgi:hypothetical protein
MNELICPYTWDCGRKFEPQEMSKHDCDFLQSATEKKMKVMLLHCPICFRRFLFDTVEWKATSFGYDDPTEKETVKESKNTQELQSILEKSQIEIPTLYFDYLTSDKFKSEIIIFKGQCKFRLYSLEELCETVSIDGNHCLRISELKGYAKSLEEIFGEENTEEFSTSELSRCFSIGYENEAILFIDYKDNNSLWIFHPDGGDIEPTKLTIEKIIKQK